MAWNSQGKKKLTFPHAMNLGNPQLSQIVDAFE